jgi:hemoglobin/transferrin/lactoferrin receptor protein
MLIFSVKLPFCKKVGRRKVAEKPARIGKPPPSRLLCFPLQRIFMKKILLFALVSAASNGLAQSSADTTLEAVPIRETVISANRSSQARSAVAQQVTILKRTEIEQINAQTTADLIQNSGAAFVQKSQQGGGSPVLRGFEASRVLLVVDGVRMNNAIYRSGHLQNIITMDNAALERAEIIFGPASTVYGSDALGGAICFYTKNPVFAAEGEGLKTTGGAFFRYGTANSEKAVHADISLAGQRFGSFTSVSFSHFGDLRMGEQEGSAPFFGLREFYAERINGQDSLVRNSDPYVQKFSGYRQGDFLQKFVWKPNDGSSHTFNFQLSTSNDIPRYDRLTDPGSGGEGLRFAEWHYGPQDRILAAYKLSLNELGWFDGGLRVTASYQNLEESRHDRRFGNANRNNRAEQIGVWGFESEAQKNWGRQSLRIGLDGQHNDVQSTAFQENIETGAVSPLSTRYPDGGSTMWTAATFATHSWQPRGSDAWTFSEGLRVGYTGLKANFLDKEFFPFPYDEATQNTPVASGSLGAVWNGAKGWRVAMNAATGFRVPNVDDLSKVFDSQPGSVIVPNPDVEPEKTLNLDLNVTRNIAGRLRWENVVWFTALRDAIVTDDFLFNGQDSILYDGELSRVLANQNKQKANLWGFSSNLEADILPVLAAYGSINYTRGRVQEEEGGDTPLDHIPPLYGRLGARWHTARANVEGFVLFNGKKPMDEYSDSGEDNPQYAPADGMPAWFTLNLRGGYHFGKKLALQIGIDNLLNVQYRTFASGINGPGRNFWLTARVNW